MIKNKEKYDEEYNKKHNHNHNDEICCPICQEHIISDQHKVYLSCCKTDFHLSCIITLYEQHASYSKKCPVCRKIYTTIPYKIFYMYQYQAQDLQNIISTVNSIMIQRRNEQLLYHALIGGCVLFGSVIFRYFYRR